MSQRIRRWRAPAARLALEFGIVVFGVFVALWADQRVAERGELRVEAARLEALRGGIATTLAELREYLRRTRDDVADLRVVIGTREGLSTEELTGSVGLALLGGLADFRPQLDALDDLRFSGELSLLEPDVRMSVSALDAALRRVAAAQDDLMRVQQLNFDRVAIERFDLAAMLIGGPDGRTASLSDDGRVFADTREFRNLAVFRIDLLSQILAAAEALEDALAGADAAIAARLASLGGA